jgi:SOS response regulatory protein OraA/RecX
VCHTSIDRIESAGPGSKARRLVFDDGSDPRLTSAAAVRELGLQIGDVTTRDELESALSAVEYRLAKERALLLLGYHEHSADELRRKLQDSGYPRRVADMVTERFIEIELVDDARFAHAWTRTRLAAGYGPRRIKQELTARGVDAELIEEALSEACESAREVELARTALGQRSATDRASKQRLIRRLVGRGFSVSAALRALETSADVFDE